MNAPARPLSVELPVSPAAAAASPFMAYRLALLSKALAMESVLRAARTGTLVTSNLKPSVDAGGALLQPTTQERPQ